MHCESYVVTALLTHVTHDAFFPFLHVLLHSKCQVLLTSLALANLWFTGRAPRILRVASAYSLSPTLVLRRVAARRWGNLMRWARGLAGLDRPKVWPNEYRAMLVWRATEGRPLAAGVPAEAAVAANGTVAEMAIEDVSPTGVISTVLPTSTCFVQARVQRLLEARYTHRTTFSDGHFLRRTSSAHTHDGHLLCGRPTRHPSRSIGLQPATSPGTLSREYQSCS